MLSSDFFSTKYLFNPQKIISFSKYEKATLNEQIWQGIFLTKYYLQAVCIISAAFSRNSMLPTVEPVAPAIKKVCSRSSTVPFLEVGMKSGKQDKTPCSDESMRKRVTFK